MTQFTVIFEDSRWPYLPKVEFSVRAQDRAKAMDNAVAMFRRTCPLENLANYVALCKGGLLTEASVA